MNRPSPLKIACVGDSITYGYGIPQRDEKSYPARLQQVLNRDADGAYEVINFGVPARTLMRNTALPYSGSWEYIRSISWEADIVLIMLGSNDSDGMHRHLIAEHFENDYHWLINSYREGREKGEPRIILMIPPKFYREGDDYMSSPGPIIRDTIAPMIRRVAQAENLEIINMYDVLGEEWNEQLIPDKLHPSAAGVELMLPRLQRALRAELSAHCVG